MDLGLRVREVRKVLRDIEKKTYRMTPALSCDVYRPPSLLTF